MRNYLKVIFLMMFLVLEGCATYSPALQDAPEGKSVVYAITTEQARRIVSSVMADQFGGREIYPLASPAVGYTTKTEMLLDTWTTTVIVTPVTAQQGQEEFPAVRISVRGAGSWFVSRWLGYTDFKARLRAELDNTGAAKFVDWSMIR